MIKERLTKEHIVGVHPRNLDTPKDPRTSKLIGIDAIEGAVEWFKEQAEAFFKCHKKEDEQEAKKDWEDFKLIIDEAFGEVAANTEKEQGGQND